jgi:hypothetical protein
MGVDVGGQTALGPRRYLIFLAVIPAFRIVKIEPVTGRLEDVLPLA